MNMKTNSNPVVLVPVHQPLPTADELFSMKRCGKLLGSHPIRIVHPVGLNLDAYLELLPTATPLPVPASWMSSIRAYNRMLINPAFYQELDCFSHALIHEPDALVISDQLFYWCKQPFDYIGAPWFEGFAVASPDAPITGVGNSGFSLINIAAVHRFLKSDIRWISRPSVFKEISKKLLRRPCVYSIQFLMAALGDSGSLRGAHRLTNDNCDLFITHHAAGNPTMPFSIADPKHAVQFSWEVNPRRCYELCHRRPPFGIHAWARYDRTFVLDMLHSLPETLVD